jgi:glycosyltransferase involved in cell wall biosynthesis
VAQSEAAVSRLVFVLDLQACQCVSRYRGIGRYSLAFAQAFLDVASGHDVRIMLNGAFAAAAADLSKLFASRLPTNHILTWHPDGPTAECDAANSERRQRAERSRERFLASFAPDFIHVGSLFEGFPDAAITSIGEDGPGPATTATLYDLIPLVHRRHYLGDDPDTPIARYYFRKLEYVRRAALTFAISEATRQEAIEYLDLDPGAVVNISTAADPTFQRVPGGELAGSDVLGRVGLTKAFVMYTGGPDRRKNIDGLIRGWAQLPRAVRHHRQLAVVCSVGDGQRASLRRLAADCGLAADELVLTGFVSDSDLVALYNLAELFVFPSWHEGFGLPVLEAMGCGTAVIAANTSSLPEVVGRADALFDPMDDKAIAASLQRVLIDQSFRAELQAHGLRRARMFSWQATAGRALAAFEACARRTVTCQTRDRYRASVSA